MFCTRVKRIGMNLPLLLEQHPASTRVSHLTVTQIERKKGSRLRHNASLRDRGLENTEREFLRETDDETPIVNSTNYHPRVSASVLRNRRMHCDKNFLSSSRFYIHREVLRLHDNNALSATFERRI